ncbi:MAG: LicD family protein [Lachnospiraceae bacterium]|nr:LicD family protein [Lachnospiraceae bacterium]
MDIKRIQEKNLKLLEVFDKACGDEIHYILGFGSALGAVRHHGFIPWDTDVDVVVPIVEIEKLRKKLLDSIPPNMKLYQWDKEKNYHPGFDRLAFKKYPHELIHIDIYPLSGAPENEWERRKFNYSSYKVYKLLHCKYKNIKYSKKKNVIPILILKGLLLPISDRRIKKIFKKNMTKYDYEKAVYTRVIYSSYGNSDITSKEHIYNVIRVPFGHLMLPIPKDYDTYLTGLYGDYMTPRQY